MNLPGFHGAGSYFCWPLGVAGLVLNTLCYIGTETSASHRMSCSLEFISQFLRYMSAPPLFTKTDSGFIVQDPKVSLGKAPTLRSGVRQGVHELLRLLTHLLY